MKKMGRKKTKEEIKNRKLISIGRDEEKIILEWMQYAHKRNFSVLVLFAIELYIKTWMESNQHEYDFNFAEKNIFHEDFLKLPKYFKKPKL